MHKQLGDFVYDDVKYEATLGKRVKKAMLQLENAARYQGEWLYNSNNEVRQGRGL
jgi:hypothetical protein